MNCSLSWVYFWILLGIALLILAIGISYAWVAAIPLFIAAGIVATVAYYIIPKIKSALLDYATCRGTAGKCSISLSINTLGQAASTLSVVSFTLAGIMELGALALIYSWFLAWLGVSIQAAVATLVLAGQFACAITALILLGVLTNANSFKNCMDQQGAGPVILAQSRK